MSETQQFIDEYSEWSSQEKFKDFGFIDKISGKWKDRLLNKEKFNFWAFLFGPFYYLYLGLFLRGSIYTILSIVLLFFGMYGLVLYLLFALTLGVRANTNYLEKLQRDRKVYADFNPDADTPYFNISSKRLVFLSLLTGGFYLMYWGYRNFKAIKNAQKDIFDPSVGAFLMEITSIHLFRSIAHSAKLVNYTKKLRPVLSGWLFFFFFILFNYKKRVKIEHAWLLLSFFTDFGYKSWNKTKEEITVEVVFMIILIVWLFITLLTLLVNKYQKAIRFYCEQKGLPSVKGFTFWEIVLITLGVLTNLWLIITTLLVIMAFL